MLALDNDRNGLRVWSLTLLAGQLLEVLGIAYQALRMETVESGWTPGYLTSVPDDEAYGAIGGWQKTHC